jgi:hypothetical protein
MTLRAATKSFQLLYLVILGKFYSNQCGLWAPFSYRSKLFFPPGAGTSLFAFCHSITWVSCYSFVNAGYRSGIWFREVNAGVVLRCTCRRVSWHFRMLFFCCKALRSLRGGLFLAKQSYLCFIVDAHTERKEVFVLFS